MIRMWYRPLILLWWSLGTYSVISATKLLHQREGREGREGGRNKREEVEKEGLKQLLFTRGSSSI